LTKHPATLAEAFRLQAARTPDAVALDDGNKQLTYGELDSSAAKLAATLVDAGAGREKVVGVLTPPICETVVAIVAALKTGAAYLPLDPLYPAHRLDFMVRDSATVAVVVPDGAATAIGDVPLIHSALAAGSSPSVSGESIVDGADAAYVIYTSGTTGSPKGVVVENRCVTRLFAATDRFRFGPDDVWSLFHSFAFDFSVWEMWGALLHGGRLVIVPRDVAGDPDAFAELLRGERVTVLNQTPSALRQLPLLGDPLESIRLLVLGGEAVDLASVARARRVLPRARITNMYGITEVTVHATWLDLTQDYDGWEGRGTPIGGSLPGSSVEILSSHSHLPVSRGELGEICVSGPGVARGYVGRPALTAERFVPHPTSGARMYLSGDLGYVDEAGMLVHVGRADSQVKIRGFRVELAEIENAATEVIGVETAVAATSVAGDALALFVIPDAEQAEPVRRIAQYRRRRPHTKIADMPNGIGVAYANTGETTFLYEEIFERASYRRSGIVIPNGGVVIDAGANIGMFALWASDQADSVAVYAIEPLPPTYELLRTNFEIHGLRGAPLRVAVGAADEYATFQFFPHDTIFSGRYAGASERQIVATLLEREQDHVPRASLDELLDDRMVTQEFRCRVRPLSDILEELSIKQVDLLKIDVEKAERDVIRGIKRRDWKRIRQVVAEVHDHETATEMAGTLESLGFSVSLGEDEGLRGTGLTNLFAVRDGVRGGRREQGPRFRGEASLRSAIISNLESVLPSHAVPNVISFTDVLPTTVNGKVDRAALVAETAPREPEDIRDLVLTAIEKEVVKAMSAALPRPATSRDAHFFESGGQSLSAVAVVRSLRQVFGDGLPLRLLFEHPRVKELATAIEDWLGGRGEEQLATGDGNARATEEADAAVDQVSAPLSVAERSLWAFQRMFPKSCALNVSRELTIDGFDLAHVTAAVMDTVREFPIFRTRFLETAKGAIRVIDDGPDEPTVVGPCSDREWQSHVNSEVERSFVLDREHPVRLTLARTEAGAISLLIVMHHIATDATTTEQLLDDLTAHLRGEDRNPHRLEDRLSSESGRGDAASRHWANVLDAPPPRLPFARVSPRGAEADFRSQSVSMRLDLSSDYLSRVEAGSGVGVTMQGALLTSWIEALQSVASIDDVAVAIPHDGRGDADARDRSVGGCFVEMVPVRVREAASAEETLRTVREQLLAILDYGPPTRAQTARSRAAAGHGPVWQTAFSYHAQPLDREIELTPGKTVKVTEVRPHQLQFDLVATVARIGETAFDVRLDYRVDDYAREDVAELCDVFVARMKRLPAELNSPRDADDDEPSAVLERIVRFAADSPDRVALVATDGISTTYGELLVQARSAAGALDELGVGRGSVVACMIPRGPRIVAVMLGVWLCGASYLPLDPEHPDEWSERIIRDAAPDAVIVEGEARRPSPIPVLNAATRRDDAFPGVRARREDIAYVVYTSGSSGTPKGVAVTHANLENLVDWHVVASSLTDGDRVIQTANPVFDAFGWEVWPALSVGATILFTPSRIKAAPDELVRFIREADGDVAFVATPVAQAMLRERLLRVADLRVLHTGGDRLNAVPPSLVPVINNYGPTEATVVATSGPVEAGSTPPSIGRPVSNVTVYLLDDRLEQVHAGDVGEIFIGGAGIALGYHRHPRLTADRFLPDPWAQEAGARMYRTGDLAARNADGTLDFRGRADEQLSVRGIRVEPSEVEHAIRQHPDVVDCSVVLVDEPDGPRLVAFVVSRRTADVEREIGEHCRRVLPAHLRPAMVRLVESLPLTPAAKIDRQALRTRAATEIASLTSADVTSSPDLSLVEVLTQEWSAVLLMDAEATTDLFAEGADSIDAARLSVRITEKTGHAVPLDFVFDAPTPLELAALLSQGPH
jgi:amino acid adenylation domain-containing protein/FkbM family methyltransferase